MFLFCLCSRSCWHSRSNWHFFVLRGGGEHQHHTSLSSDHQAFIWHLCWIDPTPVLDGYSIGAGLKVVWCIFVLGGGGDHQHHTTLSSIHQAFIWHWCWIDPAPVQDDKWWHLVVTRWESPPSGWLIVFAQILLGAVVGTYEGHLLV